MAKRLSVKEASAAYESAMRNVPPVGPGICEVCRTFIHPSYSTCMACTQQPDHLDVVAPISYSEHLGQLHTALRGYKDDPEVARRYPMVRLTAILWRFAELHEACIAAAAGVHGFGLVATVPSSTPERDEERSNLRTMVGWCKPLAERYRRALHATGHAPEGRAYDATRYTADPEVADANVLLIDDTWTTGGHAQSAAHALRTAGARCIALLVIGRHVQRDWTLLPDDETAGDRLDALPPGFDWDICTVHD